MDKRWLCVAVLVVLSAAAVSAIGLYDYDSDDYADNISQEGDRAGDDTTYVRPNSEEGDELTEPKDYVVANDSDDSGDKTSSQEDNLAKNDDLADTNNDEEQIPSNGESAEAENNNAGEVDEQNGDDYKVIDKPIDDPEKEEKTEGEETNNDSDDNGDKVLEAIQRALSEDEGAQDEDKLDVDYQVEDNRSQVENEFEDGNEDGEENIPNLDEIMQSFANDNLQSGQIAEENLMEAENEEMPNPYVPRMSLHDSLVRFPSLETDKVVGDAEASEENEKKAEKIDVPQEVEGIFADDNQEPASDNDDDINLAERQWHMFLDHAVGDDGNALDAEFKSVEKKDDENPNVIFEPEPELDLETNNEEIVDNEKSDLEEAQEIERQMVEESFVDEIVNSDEDTVNKVYADLKGDLDQLFDTLDKLADNDSDESSEEQLFEIPELDDDKVVDDALKYQVPEANQQEQELVNEDEDFVDSGEKRILQMRQDYYDSLKDYPFGFGEDEGDDDSEKAEIDEDNEQIIENDQNEDEQFAENEEEIDAEQIIKSADEIVDHVNKMLPAPITYFDDGILNENSKEQQNEQQLQQLVENVSQTVVELQETDAVSHADTEPREAETKVDNAQPNEDNEDLTSVEVNTLMTQFAIDHADDLDINSKSFDRDVSPVYITLKVGEPVVIESPNYPGAYPANNIIDWVIDGEGMGIEMNVTDLAVNGILGDYLLVKPGGIDESGTDGLIFSYQLRSERRYRFLDVDRVFIRFQSMPGMSLLSNRGFQLSLKLLMPLSEAQVPLPEPEAILQPPQHTIQVYLAGVSPRQLANRSEEFRAIVADMATMYVNRVGLEVEDFNSTEVTQLTQIATCNVNWPGFERCVGVTFGVPLGSDAEETDEEPGLTTDQLHEMWRSSVAVDPFALRLRRMGITEYVVPDDRSTLTLWLVIGFGVAISAGMLALALWRWSCFEDYTRMPAFSDTESVISDRKRNLDLYPTPHQTLPPLYDDDFVKYEDTARVDMGGFANKSYVREGGLFDPESDDDLDLPVKRDRSSNIQPKDIYQV